MLTWPDYKNRCLPGIMEINKGDLRNLNDVILQTVNMIRKVNGKYWKYDINNGILSRLQNNDNLKTEFYEYLSRLRERLFSGTDEYITKEIFSTYLE